MEDRTVVSKEKEMLQVIKNKILDSAAVLLASQLEMWATIHSSMSQTPLFRQWWVWTHSSLFHPCGGSTVTNMC